jgi:hypothetical protein
MYLGHFSPFHYLNSQKFQQTFLRIQFQKNWLSPNQKFKTLE